MIKKEFIYEQGVQTVTPQGEFYWAMVRSPETYNGKELGYSVQLNLSDEATEDMKAGLLDLISRAKDLPEFKGKKFTGVAHISTKGDNEQFKFKTNLTYKNKEGEVIQRKVPVFNRHGELIPSDVLIGNGSKGQVSFTPKVYHINAKNWGVTLYLNAMKVDDLVEYKTKGNNSSGFTFDAVEEESSSVPF